MIETNNKEDNERLSSKINENRGQTLESNVMKLRNPNLVIYNVPNDIDIQNAAETIATQNPELKLNPGDVKPRFIYKNMGNKRNMVIEVISEARKRILNTKLKLGWLICSTNNYIQVNRCFKFKCKPQSHTL